MARFTPQLRWKIAQAALLSSAGALDPLPVEEYIQASIIASIVAETSCDPIKCQIDLNFGQLYEPYIPFCVRDFTAKDCLNLFETAPGDNVVARLLAATKAQWKAAMIELAILQTVHRRHTAAEFKDEETFAAQDAYRDALVERLKQAQKQANECWGGVLEAIQTCEVSRPRIISARQQSAYLLNLDTHGFGQRERKCATIEVYLLISCRIRGGSGGRRVRAQSQIVIPGLTRGRCARELAHPSRQIGPLTKGH